MLNFSKFNNIILLNEALDLTKGNALDFSDLGKIEIPPSDVVEASDCIKVVVSAFKNIQENYSYLLKFGNNLSYVFLLPNNSLGLPTMAVDDCGNMFFNVGFLKEELELKSENVLPIIMHELMHIRLNHIGRQRNLNEVFTSKIKILKLLVNFFTSKNKMIEDVIKNNKDISDINEKYFNGKSGSLDNLIDINLLRKSNLSSMKLSDVIKKENYFKDISSLIEELQDRYQSLTFRDHNIAADYEVNNLLIVEGVTTENFFEKLGGYYNEKYFGLSYESILLISVLAGENSATAKDIKKQADHADNIANNNASKMGNGGNSGNGSNGGQNGQEGQNGQGGNSNNGNEDEQSKSEESIISTLKQIKEVINNTKQDTLSQKDYRGINKILGKLVKTYKDKVSKDIIDDINNISKVLEQEYE